ncbi:MAG: glycosyltransferase family 4 protein [Ignavibacteriales bacterium]|nr:glycosyltransferase family 4 protein [Ignavibacteriales bacterium]
MKVAIMHEWFVNYAGSEKVVESLNNIYTNADIFSIVDFLDKEDRQIILKGKKVNTTSIQNYPFAKRSFRNYLSFFPQAIEQLDFTKYDLILSSSHAFAKGIITNADQLHICYCHTPMRYAWDLYHQYLHNVSFLKKHIIKKVLHKIRMWDFINSSRVDYFIANSSHVAKRINKIYRRDAEVIHPPVDVDRFPCKTKKENYYLAASRFVPYKKMDVIIEAFNQMPDKKLVVIGDGQDYKKAKSIAKKNIELLGYVKHQDLYKYMKNAKAFVFAAEEDFGIVVVEAQACGTPVIAFGIGGVCDSVVDKKTGLLFYEQTSDSIIEAILSFEKIEDKFHPEKISKHAQKFSRTNFERKIKRFIDQKIKEF